MTAKLDYRWHLREVMATRGMFSTTDLRPLLAERGIDRHVGEAPDLLVLGEQVEQRVEHHVDQAVGALDG